MTGPTLTTALPLRSARPASPPVAAPPARLTPVEADRIADAFPARPAVAQKLYGPGRHVRQPGVVGGRIDLSA